MLGSLRMWHSNTVRSLARFLMIGNPSTCCSSCGDERLGHASGSCHDATQHGVVNYFTVKPYCTNVVLIHLKFLPNLAMCSSTRQASRSDQPCPSRKLPLNWNRQKQRLSRRTQNTSDVSLILATASDSLSDVIKTVCSAPKRTLGGHLFTQLTFPRHPKDPW